MNTVHMYFGYISEDFPEDEDVAVDSGEYFDTTVIVDVPNPYSEEDSTDPIMDGEENKIIAEYPADSREWWSTKSPMWAKVADYINSKIQAPVRLSGKQLAILWKAYNDEFDEDELSLYKKLLYFVAPESKFRIKDAYRGKWVCYLVTQFEDENGEDAWDEKQNYVFRLLGAVSKVGPNAGIKKD